MPLGIEITVFAPTLNPLTAVQILGDLTIISRQWAHELRSIARRYPHRRSGQTYVRTFRLKNDWRIDGPALIGGTLETSVTNRVRYSKYVHGTNAGLQQSWFHQGRWKTVRELADSVRPSLQLQAQAAVSLRVARAITTQRITITTP